MNFHFIMKTLALRVLSKEDCSEQMLKYHRYLKTELSITHDYYIISLYNGFPLFSNVFKLCIVNLKLCTFSNEYKLFEFPISFSISCFWG